jgi:hypothetical protein
MDAARLANGRQRFGDPIVALDARHLLDQVFFPQQVSSVARDLHLDLMAVGSLADEHAEPAEHRHHV